MIDSFLVSYIASIRNSFLDSMFCFNTNYITTILLFFVMCFFILLNKKRKIIFCFIPAYLFTLGFVGGMKWFIARARPFEVLGLNLVDCVEYGLASWNHSFPSWHAAFIFLFFPFLVYMYGRKAWIFLLFAGFYSFSRVYLGFHYFSDVIFGAFLGYFIGLIAIRLCLKGKKKIY